MILHWNPSTTQIQTKNKHITIDFELLLDMISYHGFKWTPKSLHTHGELYQQAFQQSAGSKRYKSKVDI